MLIADGFDNAIIGWTRRHDLPDLAVYSYDKCVAILMDRDGIDYEGAVEYMEFNVVTAWMGEESPLFVRKSDRKGLNLLADELEE